MRKALITELRTFIDMSGFHTVTSIFFGGGECYYGCIVIVMIECFNCMYIHMVITLVIKDA